MTDLFREDPTFSESSRFEYAKAVTALAENGFSSYIVKAAEHPLAKALGFPFTAANLPTPSISKEYVGSDSLCEISRLRINVLPSLPFFGLMFVPHGVTPPYNLCIAAHGNLGTPELMYGMHGKNGYSNLIPRLLAKGVCVFAPQFLIWNCGMSPAKPQYETAFNRQLIDEKLKSHGGGINALEIFSITRCVDALLNLHIFNREELSVCGMSYGALLTLRAMALDKRIKKGYFMCCFNGGIDDRFPEWEMLPNHPKFYDSDIAGMCAPRPVFVEVAAKDEFFPLDGAIRMAERTKAKFRAANAGENFVFSIYDGFHIVPPESCGVDFITQPYL
ncbi:MAG: hypothetical protein E7473_01115 [Ruminococcaceae bacterium]|nr:hypothetical protein [Oscillospiraceae bacterium]